MCRGEIRLRSGPGVGNGPFPSYTMFGRFPLHVFVQAVGRAEKRFPVRIFDPGRTSGPLWFPCMRVPGGMGGPGNLWERHWTVRPWACSASRCSCFLRVGAVVAAFCGRFGAGRSFGAGRDRAAPKSLPFFDISSSVAVSSGGQSEVRRKKYVDFFAKDWLKWKKCLPLFL